jgi:hypothetical protein
MLRRPVRLRAAAIFHSHAEFNRRTAAASAAPKQSAFFVQVPDRRSQTTFPGLTSEYGHSVKFADGSREANARLPRPTRKKIRARARFANPGFRKNRAASPLPCSRAFSRFPLSPRRRAESRKMNL